MQIKTATDVHVARAAGLTVNTKTANMRDAFERVGLLDEQNFFQRYGLMDDPVTDEEAMKGKAVGATLGALGLGALGAGLGRRVGGRKFRDFVMDQVDQRIDPNMTIGEMAEAMGRKEPILAGMDNAIREMDLRSQGSGNPLYAHIEMSPTSYSLKEIIKADQGAAGEAMGRAMGGLGGGLTGLTAGGLGGAGLGYGAVNYANEQ